MVALRAQWLVGRWQSCTDRALRIRTTCNDLERKYKTVRTKTNISHHATKNMPYIRCRLSDGRILQVTDSHPLMLANGEWGAFDVEKCVREYDWMEV